MCMLDLSSAIKGKIISHYPDSGDAMYRALLIRLFSHASRIHNNKLLTYYFVDVDHWVILESLENFKQIILCYYCKCGRSKLNANSKPSAQKMRMELPKMDSFVSRVPSKQSKLQFQPCQKSKYSVKSISLFFPSTSTVTSKNKNVTNSISENIVNSSCKTSPIPSLNFSLAREKIYFSNSVTLAALPSSFSSRDFFYSNVALSDSTSSATEPFSFLSNLSAISKSSDLANIASEENDESSIDFSKILGCKKDVSILSKLKNLSNVEKLKLIRSVFLFLVSDMCFP